MSDSDENGAPPPEDGEATGSESADDQQQNGSGIKSGAKSNEGSGTKSNEGSIKNKKSNTGSGINSNSKSKEGSAIKSSDGSKTKSKDGSGIKSGDGSKNKSKDGSAIKSAVGSKQKSKDASAIKSSEESKNKSDMKSSTKSNDGSAMASKNKSKDSSMKSKSKDGSAMKTKSKGEGADGENSAIKSSEGSKKSNSGKSKTSPGSEMKSKTKSATSATSQSGSNAGSSMKKSSKEGSAIKSSDGGSRSKVKSKTKSAESVSSKRNSNSKMKSRSGESKDSLMLSQSSSKQSKNQKSRESTISKGGKSSNVSENRSRSRESADVLHKKQKKKVDLGGAKIGFVGAGKMSDALVRGLITYAKIDPKKIFVASKTSKNLDIFHAKGVTVSKRSYDIFGQYDCDVIFLCIHGFVIRSCFKGGGTRPFAFTINYIPNQKHPIYILSLIGGVNLNDIKLTLLDPENPEKYILEIHRAMLNIGVGYGLGMGAIDVDPDSKKCSPVVRDLLTSITKLDYFPEQIMDAVCIIGGNGLAFCYYFLSAMADGGFKMGLNKIMSIKLSAKALQSAAQCLLESGKHPSELQDSVISSGGPAIYGIHVLDKADCASGFQTAIEHAYRRLKELVDIEPIAEIEAKPNPF